MKKVLYLLLLLISLISGCGKFEKWINIPKDQIQQAINKKFPYDKNLVIARFKLDSPEIYFKETKIGLKLKYYGNFLNKELEGLVDFNGELIYNQEKGAFYLRNFEIIEISVNESNFSSKDKLKKTILNLLNNYLDDYPVYKLKQSDFKQSIAKLFLKNIVVQDAGLSILLGL